MVDLKLKRVSIRSWMKIRQTDLEFPEKGLILVQGINTASGGALLSVGSGKTGLGEAISRTLLGVPGRFASLRQFSTHKNGDLYVKIEAELHGKPLVVESGYKCKELSPTGDALQYTYDGKKIQRGLIQQTRDQLSKLLGVSPLLASWTVFVDGDKIKFNKISQADCVDLVMSSLRQPPWTDYHEIAKKATGKFRRTMAQTEANHKTAQDAVAEAGERVRSFKEALSTAKADYDLAVKENEQAIRSIKKQIEELTHKIDTTKDEMEEIEKKLKAMEKDRAVASHKLEIQLHEIEDQLRDAQSARQPFGDARDLAQQKATEAKSDHDNYANAAKECPTCKRPMGKIDPVRLRWLKEQWQKAKDKATDANTAWTGAEQKVITLNERYREVSKKHREVSAKQNVETMADRHEELGETIDSVLNKIHDHELEIAKLEAGPSDSAVKATQIQLADTESVLQKADAKLDAMAIELASDQSTLKVLDYWTMAFSPYGIPNMILSDAIGPLNKEARRISAAMTGGTIDVRYSTTRELATGLDKAQLNIEVDNKLGDEELGGSSKGEAGLTNFVIAETLSEVGQVSRRVGYVWLDEVSPHQDTKVCHNLYSYLKEKTNKLGILIFLVDHNPVAANYADRILIVEKKGNTENCETTVSWR